MSQDEMERIAREGKPHIHDFIRDVYAHPENYPNQLPPVVIAQEVLRRIVEAPIDPRWLQHARKR